MAKDPNNGWKVNVSLPRGYSTDLRGKQSVRATFKLTTGCIDAISIVATHLGIKQKSLFDHLVEDVKSLQSIAQELSNSRLRRHNRIQKTFVISRRTLHWLDELSKSYNAPRDALVEYSVQRLLPIIVQEQKRHEQRKAAFAEIEKHFRQGWQLLERLKNTLEPEDQVLSKMETVMGVYVNAYSNMEAFIEKGKIIEDFDPEMMKQILLARSKK
jgi:hypothetical protein